MCTNDDSTYAIIRRIQEVNTLAQYLSANVVLSFLPTVTDYELALSTPEPMFDDFSDGPESWSVVGILIGKGETGEQVFRVYVAFQVELIDGFDDVIKLGVPRVRHEKIARVGISDQDGKGKSRIPSRYLKVSLPDDLKFGKYEVHPGNSGFRGFTADDFMPLHPGSGELVDDHGILAAFEDAVEADKAR